LERRADETLRSFKGCEPLALEDLEYSKRLLESHLQHIEDVQTFIGPDIDRKRWNSGEQLPEAQVQALLMDDFAHLARHARRLLVQMSDGISFIANAVMLEESRKAIEKADNMHRLTLLAFFFLPLSFVTSLFGTNFKELGTGILSIWLLFIVIVPLTILAGVICFWSSVTAIDCKTRFKLGPSRKLPRYRY
jgi:Mg2+ and Co2+ transporter CorA